MKKTTTTKSAVFEIQHMTIESKKNSTFLRPWAVDEVFEMEMDSVRCDAMNDIKLSR